MRQQAMKRIPWGVSRMTPFAPKDSEHVAPSGIDPVTQLAIYVDDEGNALPFHQTGEATRGRFTETKTTDGSGAGLDRDHLDDQR